MQAIPIPDMKVEGRRRPEGSRSPRPSSRSVGILVASVFALVIGSLYAYDPAKGGFYPVCYFHSATGLLCPGCGCLRAMHQLLHGDIIAALHYNSLLVLSLIAMLLWTGIAFVRTGKLRFLPSNLNARSIWIVLTISMIFGIARNLPFAKSVWLAP
jgi:hypothetical protein